MFFFDDLLFCSFCYFQKCRAILKPIEVLRLIPVYFDAPLVGVNKSLKFLLWNYCLNSVLKNRSTPLIEAPPDGGIEK